MSSPAPFRVLLAALSVLGLGLPLAVFAQQQPTPTAVVGALEAKFGVHPGQRRNHTKGFCFSGHFEGAAAVRPLSRSAMFSGTAIPVIGRFSQAGGNPNAPDDKANTHGMALRFSLPGGAVQQMAMLDIPFFDVATPEGFFAKLKASTPDPATGHPDPAKMEAFKKAHPEFVRFEKTMKGVPRIPDGYQHDAFNSIHTFFLVDASGHETAVRWRFVPVDGQRRLSDKQAASRDADFLIKSLQERLKTGPVRWTMRVTLAAKGDPLIDPSVQWTGPHKTLDAGTLTVDAVQSQADGKCAPINFDPMVIADGIKPSDDPVLHFRSPAYAISFGRRISEKP